MNYKELLLKNKEKLLNEIKAIDDMLFQIDTHVKDIDNAIFINVNEFYDIDKNQLILDSLTDKYGSLPNFVYEILEGYDLVLYCKVVSFGDWKVITFK